MSQSTNSSPPQQVTDPNVLLQQALERIQALESIINSNNNNNNNNNTPLASNVNVSSSHIYEPKVGTPEPFDGTRSKLRTFLALCDNAFNAQPSVYGVFGSSSYNVQARITYAVSYLRGAAIEWWISLRGTNHPALTHWSAFQVALLEQYDDPEAKRNAQLSLEVLRQARNQSVAEFAQKFRPIATASGLGEGELIYRFRRALLAEIQDGLVFSPTPNSISELIASATKCEVRIAERRMDARDSSLYANAMPSNGVSPMDLGATFSTTQSSSSRRLTPEVRAERFAKGLCIYCGLAGHRVKNCPNTPSNKSVTSNVNNKANSN